jgi:L-aspartate oxidase
VLQNNQKFQTLNSGGPDVIIVGTGASGLFAAICLPSDINILMLSKSALDESDSFLAQGGICVMRDEADFEAFFQDTMNAGHNTNNKEAVEIMVRSSQDIIKDLIALGVAFDKDENGNYKYTREGAHSRNRIMFCKDKTGAEITKKLLEHCLMQKNIKIISHITMTDLIEKDGVCKGVVCVKNGEEEKQCFSAPYTILATGGIGGRYENTTNYRHLRGDAIDIVKKHGIKVVNEQHVQVHPTAFYSQIYDRRFLISESVRGEGAKLIDKNGNRWTDELLPRDVLTGKILQKMEEDGSKCVWLDMRDMGEEYIKERFPTIYKTCLSGGIDITKELIPVVPAQHYYMGGIDIDMEGRTSMAGLFAVGETSYNGVHGENRLASNSLLEGLVFAKRVAGVLGAELKRIENDQ